MFPRSFGFLAGRGVSHACAGGQADAGCNLNHYLGQAMRELTVGEAAKRSGLAVSALHFYERKGLIRSLRTAGNQRRYGADVLRRLAIIRVAQRVGMPLGAVRRAFDTLPHERTPRARSGRRCRRRGATSWRRASTSCSISGSADRLHRLRLPVPDGLQPRESGDALAVEEPARGVGAPAEAGCGGRRPKRRMGSHLRGFSPLGNRSRRPARFRGGSLGFGYGDGCSPSRHVRGGFRRGHAGFG